MAKKKSRRKRLEETIEEIEAALDLAYSADQSLVDTQIQISSLMGAYWLHRRRLASAIVADDAESDQNRARARGNEIDFDRRHQECLKQYSSLVGKRHADDIQSLIARLDELDAVSNELRTLAAEAPR